MLSNCTTVSVITCGVVEIRKEMKLEIFLAL